MMRKMIVCGFALACLLVVTANASACGHRYVYSGTYCDSYVVAPCNVQPAPVVYYQPATPVVTTYYTYTQPVQVYTTNCVSTWNCGRVYYHRHGRRWCR
jgi:hypothetical protein